MALEFHWVLPTEGDPPRLDPQGRTRQPAHWIAVAQAAKYAGFNALLVPTGVQRPDAWLVAAALARHTQRLGFIVAFRPGLVLPAVAAQRAQTLHELSGQRLLLSVLTGGDAAEHHGYGDLINHDDRFVRAAEFLRVVRQVWKGRGACSGIDHHGAHYRLQNGGLSRPLRQPPALYVGGASPASERVAAEQAQVYYGWAEAPALLQARVQRVTALAAGQGRSLRVGCRLHVVARTTEAEAQREAGTMLRGAEIAPNLWPIARPAGGRNGVALVGSYARVAQRMAGMQSLGIESFILSADAGLDDALRLGEELLPLVGARPTSAKPVPAELRG